MQEEGYLLECHRYIELNPVRAAMVEHPGMYRWSSYRANAQGEASAFLRGDRSSQNNDAHPFGKPNGLVWNFGGCQ